MLTIRCSSLPRISLCPASAQSWETTINTDSEESRQGSAAHWITLERIVGREHTIAEACQKFNVDDADELEVLCGMGWAAWRKVADHFPDPQIEVEFQGTDQNETVLLTGHIDLLSVVDGQVRILDLKFGRVERSHEQQVRGYAWLTLQRARYGAAQEAYLAVLWVREQRLDAELCTRQQLDSWYADLERHVSDTSVYNPGYDQCAYCPGFHLCGPRRAMLSISAEAICGHDYECTNPTDDPAIYAEMLDRVKMVERTCQSARELIRSAVRSAGGVLPTGDGRELVLKDIVQRKLIPRTALPVLHEVLTGDEVMDCMTLSGTKAQDAVKSKAGRGQKKAVADELMALLDEAGAINHVTVERLECRKAAVAQIGVES